MGVQSSMPFEEETQEGSSESKSMIYWATRSNGSNKVISSWSNDSSKKCCLADVPWDGNSKQESHRLPALSEPEAKRTKKKLKVSPFVVSPTPAVAPPATNLPTPTPSVAELKDKGKAPVISLVHRSLRFVAKGKLMVGAMHAVHVLDTR